MSQAEVKNKKIGKDKKKKKKQKVKQVVDLLSEQQQQQIVPNQQHLFSDIQIEEQIDNENVQSNKQSWPSLPKCLFDRGSVILIGIKNTGKSTLAQYLLKNNQCALLDCDIGRNFQMQGCLSLTSGDFCKRVWIGQFSPLNNISNFLKGIKYLLSIYNKQLFTKKLIVNTMGYTTGLGELLLYQTYHIIQPHSVLLMQTADSVGHLNGIVRQLQTGQYRLRLYFNPSVQSHSCTISTYTNHNCKSKKSKQRFIQMFSTPDHQVTHFTQLLKLIIHSQNPLNTNPAFNSKKRSDMLILQQSRHEKQNNLSEQIFSYRKLQPDENISMRLVVIGKVVQENEPQFYGLFLVQSIGFGYNDKLYYRSQTNCNMGIVSQGIDFQKGFYHMNEKQMIELELRYGRIQHIMVLQKCLGSKGVRNNPAKTV